MNNITEKQLKRIFYLGDEYGPDFIGLHSSAFEMDGKNLICTIRVIVVDIDRGFKPVTLRTRKITVDVDGEFADEEYYDEPYTEEVMKNVDKI